MKIQRKQSGFTIIELLVVLAVIGILGSVGFVAIANSNNKVKKAEIEVVLAETKGSIDQYNRSFNTYPDTLDTLITYMNSTDNNDAANKLSGVDIPEGTFTYSANDNEESGTCTIQDEDANGEPESGTCTTFTLTATASYWGASSPDQDLVIAE